MSVVGLIWKAVLALLGLGALIVALFVVTLLLIVAVKALKKEVQGDDRTE